MARKTIAVDYGSARIGIAVTDEENRFALAHSVIPNFGDDDAAGKVAEIAKKEGAGTVVIGLPLGLSGAEGPQARMARAFGDALKAASGLNIEFYDERFTSADGRHHAAEKGTEIDSEAARLILDGWMRRKTGGEKSGSSDII